MCEHFIQPAPPIIVIYKNDEQMQLTVLIL